MRYFQVFVYPDKPESVVTLPPESFGMGKMRQTAPKKALGYIIYGGQDGKIQSGLRTCG